MRHKNHYIVSYRSIEIWKFLIKYEKKEELKKKIFADNEFIIILLICGNKNWIFNLMIYENMNCKLEDTICI
jgi:hypothetical protein